MRESRSATVQSCLYVEVLRGGFNRQVNSAQPLVRKTCRLCVAARQRGPTNPATAKACAGGKNRMQPDLKSVVDSMHLESCPKALQSRTRTQASNSFHSTRVRFVRPFGGCATWAPAQAGRRPGAKRSTRLQTPRRRMSNSPGESLPRARQRQLHRQSQRLSDLLGRRPKRRAMHGLCCRPRQPEHWFVTIPRHSNKEPQRRPPRGGL